MYLNTIALHSSKVRHLFVGFFQKHIFVVVVVGFHIKEHLKYPTLHLHHQWKVTSVLCHILVYQSSDRYHTHPLNNFIDPPKDGTKFSKNRREGGSV